MKKNWKNFEMKLGEAAAVGTPCLHPPPTPGQKTAVSKFFWSTLTGFRKTTSQSLVQNKHFSPCLFTMTLTTPTILTTLTTQTTLTNPTWLTNHDQPWHWPIWEVKIVISGLFFNLQCLVLTKATQHNPPNMFERAPVHNARCLCWNISRYFFSPSEDTKIFYWNCGCAIDQPLLSLLLLNKLCSSAEPSQSNLYNSFQFYELRQAEVGQIEKEEEKSTESELVSILGAGKNKLPGNSFSTKEITNSVQQILKFKGRYIHSHFGQRANVMRPKIFSSCVVGKMMRERGILPISGFCKKWPKGWRALSETLQFHEKTLTAGIVMQFTRAAHRDISEEQIVLQSWELSCWLRWCGEY